MEKMQNVYKENPKLGDPNSLGQSLEQTSQKIAGLAEEREKFLARDVRAYTHHTPLVRTPHRFLIRTPH